MCRQTQFELQLNSFQKSTKFFSTSLVFRGNVSVDFRRRESIFEQSWMAKDRLPLAVVSKREMAGNFN